MDLKSEMRIYLKGLSMVLQKFLNFLYYYFISD